MPIRLVAIESIPIATNPEATTFEDQEFATLEITDSAGNVVARPRVPVADIDLGEIDGPTMQTSIEEDGPRTIATLVFTP